MKHIEKMIEMAESEMGSFAQNGKLRTRDEIDAVYKLMDIVKDGYCILDMEGGASYDDNSYRMDGVSYRRGQRRDSMGRYTSRGYSRNDYDYSEDRGEFAERLQNLMEHAPDKETRQGLKRMLDQMQG